MEPAEILLCKEDHPLVAVPGRWHGHPAWYCLRCKDYYAVVRRETVLLGVDEVADAEPKDGGLASS